jgi:hypothetical protein
MPNAASPIAALRAFDISAEAFTAECGARFEAGRALAAADIDRLWSLAERVAHDISTWTTAWRALEVGRDGAFPPDACGGRLIECLFDDALTAPAARVLSAAMEVALRGVTTPLAPGERAEDP